MEIWSSDSEESWSPNEVQDMEDYPTRDARNCKNDADASLPQLARWKRLIDAMPDIRLEKVQAMRDALRRNCYDQESILDETVARISNELGVSQYLHD